MRSWTLASLLLACAGCAGCAVRVPATPGLQISVRADVRVKAEAELRVKAQPAVAVPLEGATVVEFFGIPLEGVEDVVFVLDRSGSMNEPAQGRIGQLHAADTQAGAPRKIDVARAELIDALGRLPAGTRLNVIFFDSGLEGYAATMVPLDEAGRAELIDFVQQAAAAGSTALAPAMRTAFLMNAKRIVLLSDGLGNVGGNSGAVLRDAREATTGGVRIDTIGVGRGQDAHLLRTLAVESGGIYQPL